MQTTPLKKNQKERGVSIVFFLIVLLLVWSIAALAIYVTSNSTLQHRRSDYTAAVEYADGAAVVAARDLEIAFTNNTAGTTFFTRLLTNATGSYTIIATNSNILVYQRTISAPFTNQTVVAQILVTNTTYPQTAQVICTATVGYATATNTLNVEMPFAYGAAIVNVNAGTSDTSVNKTSAKADGNAVVTGNGNGPLVVDGESGLAILANSRVNIASSNDCTVPSSSISMTNEGSANQVPDYTSQGTANELFDLGRFIAVSDLTSNGYAPSGNNHFTDLGTFMMACNTHTNSSNCIEGIITVDITNTDGNLNQFQPGNGTVKTNPPPPPGTGSPTYSVSGYINGINVRGTLLFNFLGSSWSPNSAGFVTTVPININAANLSGMVATNTKTYSNAYPPVYVSTNHNPINVNITSRGYQNFSASDDLPALLFSTSEIDFHGPLDICGVVYTPCYVEIENTQNGQTQYINGALITGGGVYLENNSAATTVVTYDQNAVGALATSNNVGRKVLATYWQ